MAKKEINQKKFIEETAKSLLEHIGLAGKIVVDEDDEDKEVGVFSVKIETEEAGILIGKRGETLSAFQDILRQIVFTKTKEPIRIIVNVGDWRERREEVLKSLAKTAADKVRENSEPQHIYDLSPAERRFIHMLFAEDSKLVTESEGEGRDRHLVIKLKSTKPKGK